MSGISCGAGGAPGSPTGTEACGAAGDGAGMTSGGMGASSVGEWSVLLRQFLSHAIHSSVLLLVPTRIFQLLFLPYPDCLFFLAYRQAAKYHFRISTIVKITLMTAKIIAALTLQAES